MTTPEPEGRKATQESSRSIRLSPSSKMGAREDHPEHAWWSQRRRTAPRISHVGDVDGPFQSCVQRTPWLSEIIGATQQRLSKVWLFRNKYNKKVEQVRPLPERYVGTERDPVSGVPHQGTMSTTWCLFRFF